MLNNLLQIIRTKCRQYQISHLNSFIYLMYFFVCRNNSNKITFCCFKKCGNKVFSQTKPIYFLCYFVIFRIKKVKAALMNKMKKRQILKHIYDYNIHLFIKENICNLQEHIVQLFLEATTKSKRY